MLGGLKPGGMVLFVCLDVHVPRLRAAVHRWVLRYTDWSSLRPPGDPIQLVCRVEHHPAGALVTRNFLSGAARKDALSRLMAAIPEDDPPLVYDPLGLL